MSIPKPSKILRLIGITFTATTILFLVFYFLLITLVKVEKPKIVSPWTKKCLPQQKRKGTCKHIVKKKIVRLCKKEKPKSTIYLTNIYYKQKIIYLHFRIFEAIKNPIIYIGEREHEKSSHHNSCGWGGKAGGTKNRCSWTKKKTLFAYIHKGVMMRMQLSLSYVSYTLHKHKKHHKHFDYQIRIHAPFWSKDFMDLRKAVRFIRFLLKNEYGRINSNHRIIGAQKNEWYLSLLHFYRFVTPQARKDFCSTVLHKKKMWKAPNFTYITCVYFSLNNWLPGRVMPPL